MLEYAAGLACASESAAAATGAPFHTIVLTHVQDEADLRLRSFFDQRPDAPSRGRASKVQQHVCTLFAYGSDSTVPTELEALAEKRAVTLATSFEGVLRNLALSIFHAGIDRKVQVWFTHILVGRRDCYQ